MALQALSYDSVSFVDPTANKKLYEQYKISRELEIWKISEKYPLMTLCGKLTFPAITKAISKNIYYYMKQNLLNPFGQFFTSWIDIEAIQLNYNLIKLLYGSVDDSVSQLLSEGFPRFAYPYHPSINTYYQCENSLLNLKINGLIEGKEQICDIPYCIEGFQGQKWLCKLHFYEKHFFSPKKVEGISIIYFTDLQPMEESLDNLSKNITLTSDFIGLNQKHLKQFLKTFYKDQKIPQNYKYCESKPILPKLQQEESKSEEIIKAQIE